MKKLTSAKSPAKSRKSPAKKYRSHGMANAKRELEGWMDFAHFTLDLLETAHNFCSFVEDVIEGPEDKE
jgi:hypothetical protein